jgi:TPR repeat protein
MSEQDKKGTSTQSPRKESLDELVFADPWLKKATKTSIPDDALFACAYDLHIVVDLVAEAVFFRRTETCDELWIAEGFDLPIVKGTTDGNTTPTDFVGKDVFEIGRVFAVPKKGEESSSCLTLLDRLFRAYVGFCSPQGFLAAGIISESAYNNLVKRIEQELEENSRKARETETEIIKVARNLGLSPKPTGEGPSHWFARCPGKIHGKTGNHVLFINAAEDSFGCGWCCRKGGVEELRAFVRERKLGGVEKKEDLGPIKEEQQESNEDGRPDVVSMELEGVEKQEDRGPTKKEQQESKYGEELVELGYRLEKGHDFDQDYGKAIELYTLASAEGNSTAMNHIGWLYLNGLGVKRNLKAAVEWFEKAARYGNTRAMTNLGNICEGYGLDDEGNTDYKGAVKWYTEAAQSGDPKAKLNLGNLYHYGHGVRKNYRKAAEIYKELAMSGYVNAYFYMGLYFQNGFHFQQNYDAARYFYEMGAAANDSLSMMNLGVMYSKGLGVEVDNEKALHWYIQAGERGDTLAYANIGWFFETGRAVEQDYTQAMYWYKKGAEAQEPHAMNNLGAMYERGLGVKKDQKKAEYWFAKAREALESQPFLESPATEIN